MTPERWHQIDKLCQAALELDESRRNAFVELACGDDQDLRREVESLLLCKESGEGFIEQPALELVAKMMAADEPESLVGQQIASYKIVSLLGRGGMGVVYEARDTRLNRAVAIKVLPADQTSDPERKRRFIQEARAASALNHPNIITIYDIGIENGLDFIVMEYVTGKTLDQRIPRKGMKVEEALKIAIQVADALAKAHAAGIVHRDLKPTNVMVTDDGLVKVLDFGLAKLTEVLSEEGATRSTQLQTEEGMILGTLSYMSPEQAEGKKVDARSDIFSFGSVLYEMVSGRKAFDAESKLSTLTAIVKQDPKPISQLAPATPRDLEKIMNRCLRKDLGQRFQHMDDLKVELEEVRRESDSNLNTMVGAQAQLVARSNKRLWVGAAGAMGILAIAAGVWLFRGRPEKPAAPKETPFTSYAGSERSPSFSPDGNQVVFSWNGEKQDNADIYVKLIDSPTQERLTTDPAEDISPAFSPDGRSIGFVRVSKEHAVFIIIPAIGGPERIVAEVPPSPYGPASFVERAFAWLPNGNWIITDGLMLLSTESGEKRNLTSPPKSPFDYSPAVSPDGRTIAFSRFTGLWHSDIYLIELAEDLKPQGAPRRLTSLKANSHSASWTPNGREIIFSAGDLGDVSLWRVPASGVGDPELVPFSVGGASSAAISRTGNRLAYSRGVVDSNIWRLSLETAGVASGPPTRLIASTRNDSAPQYSPDGKQIAFESLRSGPSSIWISDADGSHAEELFSREGAPCGTPRWSPDGQRIAFDHRAEGNFDIYVIRASRGGKPMPLTTDSAEDQAPSWSRDGKWVYFTSRRTGRDEVWKVSVEGGKALPVTYHGGQTAFESLDGKSIYYMKGSLSGLWRMPVSGGEESQVLPSVFSRAFSLVKEGIYFIPAPGGDRKSFVQFLSFSTDKVKTVAPMSGLPYEGLSVSPDGRSLIFSQFDELGRDLMLVENFR